MQYTTYPFYTDKVLEILARRDGMFKKNKPTKKRSLKNIMNRADIDELDEITDTMSVNLFSYEKYWEKQGSHVVFLDSPNIIEYLLKCKLNGEIGTFPDSPISSMIINFPKGTQLGTHKISSVLCSLCDGYEFTKHHDLPFKQQLGIETDRETLKEVEEAEKSKTMSICLHTLDTGQILRFAYHAEELFKALTTTDPDKYMESKSTGAYRNEHNMIGLEAGKLIYTMLVHLSVHPEDLINGFPKNYSPGLAIKNRARTPRQLNNLRFSPNVLNIKSAHFRAGHFRQLRDDRYYKGEHENKPKGSRWVAVSPSSVNRRIEPHTIEKIT